MEFKPYGPMEEAISRSIAPDSPSVNKNNGFWWGVLAATVVYGLIAWIGSVDYKILRKDKPKELPPENRE